MDAVKHTILSGHEGFISDFVQEGGVTKIVAILHHPMREIVLAALDAIPAFFEAEPALQYMKQRQKLFTQIYEQMDSRDGLVRRKTHEVFISLCASLGCSAFGIITQAAKNCASRANKTPLAELVVSLNRKWDIEVRHTALLLINCIIVKSPGEKGRAKFVARLENLGLYDELRSLATVRNHPGILLQLQNFQVNTMQVFPGMHFEVERHKHRIK